MGLVDDERAQQAALVQTTNEAGKTATLQPFRRDVQQPYAIVSANLVWAEEAAEDLRLHLRLLL